MKKLLSVLTIIAMTAAVSASALAAETDRITSDGGSASATVKGIYAEGEKADIVYSVDVSWGEMEFTYSVGGTKVWDKKNHTYSVRNATSGWSESGNTVRVTNHSNADIRAVFSFEAEGERTLSGEFTYDNHKVIDQNGAIPLSKCMENRKSDADYVTASLRLSGRPAGTEKDFTKAATVTVKIMK